jgi:hypothetical protein
MATRKLSRITIPALILIGATLILATFGAITVSTNLSSSGTISTSAGIGVYSDVSCNNAISTLDWGTVTPGGTVTRTVYIKNTGTGLSLSLTLTTTNWNPTNANGPITITWNQGATTLTPGQSVTAVITLSAAPSITDITSFGVQINIIGTNQN